MKAILKKERAPGLHLEDVPMPTVGINDVLIKVKRTAICGTDVHIFNWDDWAQKTIPAPMVIGHEFAGVVEQVGSNVVDFHPGDIVSGEGHIVCGRCRNCLAGRRHLCMKTSGVGVNRPGAFAEYISIPVTNVWYATRKYLGYLGYFRSAGQCCAFRFVLQCFGRRYLNHRRRPDRHHGGRHLQTCRRVM